MRGVRMLKFYIIAKNPEFLSVEEPLSMRFSIRNVQRDGAG